MAHWEEIAKIGGAVVAGAVAWGSLSAQVSSTNTDIAALVQADHKFQQQLLDLREQQVRSELEQTRILSQMQADIAVLKENTNRKR